MEQIKKCPFCAEEINIEAIKCKHCGSMLNTQEAKELEFWKNSFEENIKIDSGVLENKKEKEFQEKISWFPEYIQDRVKKDKSLIKKIDKTSKEEFINYMDNSIRKERLFLIYFLWIIFSWIWIFIWNIFGLLLSFWFIYSIWLHPRKWEKIFLNRLKDRKKYKFRFYISLLIWLFLILPLWSWIWYENKKKDDEIKNTPIPTIEILNKDFSWSIVNNYKTNNTNTWFLLDFKVLNADYITLNSQTLDFNTWWTYKKNIELIRPLTSITIFVKNKYKEANYNFNIERNMTDDEKKKEEELKKQEEADRIQREKDEEKRRYEERIAKNWYYDEYKDEMTWYTTKIATAEAENTLYFDFPYQWWSTSYLTVRNMRWELDIILWVSPSQINWDYNYPTIKAKFDDWTPINYSYNEPADYSSDKIFIRSENDFLNRLKKAKKLLLEVWFYQNWTKTIEFDVEWLKW